MIIINGKEVQTWFGMYFVQAISRYAVDGAAHTEIENEVEFIYLAHENWAKMNGAQPIVTRAEVFGAIEANYESEDWNAQIAALYADYDASLPVRKVLDAAAEIEAAKKK